MASKKPGRSALRHLTNRGMTLRQISKQYGVSHVTVFTWLKNYGIARRPIGRPPIKNNEILRYLDKGFTQQQTANIFGLSRNALTQRLYRRGLTNVTADEWKEIMETSERRKSHHGR